MKDLILHLQSKLPVILDGATATELQRLGVPIKPPLWTTEALITPEGQKILLEVHKSYVEAGADVITTNTFRTNRAAIVSSGLDIDPVELVRIAVSTAREAIDAAEFSKKRKIYVAGSLAPVADAYKPELAPTSDLMYAEHRHSINALHGAGVDFILAETINNWREAYIIGRLCKEIGVPFVISFVCDSNGFLLSGENYSLLGEFVNEYSPLAIGINCTPLNSMKEALARLALITEVTLCAYPNVEDRSSVNKCEHVDQYLRPNISVPQFAEFMLEASQRYGVSLLGGCCGTTPKYIRVLRELVDNGKL